MSARIHCQVIEMPETPDDWSDGETAERAWPRDLLPWADPYIALLMLKLERGYEMEECDADLLAHELEWSPPYLEDCLEEEEELRIYGGFPLLEA